jgi:hypothetical protein
MQSDLHQIHLERYQEVLAQRHAKLQDKLTAAAQALDWAVIEQTAAERLTSKQRQTLQSDGLIGTEDQEQRRKEVADLGRRLGALEALIEAVDELARVRRNL